MAIKIAYWTGTGNTEIMAECIAEGIASCGMDVELYTVNDIDPSELFNEEIYVLGCPAMGCEVLEELEMEPFVEALEPTVSGKKIGLFGSYGWCDGEWMRNWEERMTELGAEVIGGEGMIAYEEPDDEAKEKCREYGKLIASYVKG